MFKMKMHLTFVQLGTICIRCHQFVNCHYSFILRRSLSGSSKSHYELLQVSQDASTAEIKESFLKLSKELHPDRNPGSLRSHEEFVKLNEAFSTLKSPNKRRQYDISIGNYPTTPFAPSSRSTDQSGVKTESSRPFDWSSIPQGPFSYHYRDLGGADRASRSNRRENSGKNHQPSYREQSFSYTSPKRTGRRIRARFDVSLLGVASGFGLLLFYIVYQIAKIESFKYRPDTSVRRFPGGASDIQYQKFVRASKQAASDNREKLSANIKRPRQHNAGVKSINNHARTPERSKRN